MAASLAARLRKERNAQVETVRGGLGEFTVLVDGQEVISTNRLWYPNTTKAFEAVVKSLRPEGS